MRKNNHKLAVGMFTPAIAQNVDRPQLANYATNESNRNVFDYGVANAKAVFSRPLRFWM